MQEASNHSDLYVYGYTFKRRTTYILWLFDGPRGDVFLLNGCQELIKGKTPEDVLRLNGYPSEEIVKNEPVNMNFDLFWQSLRNLAEGKASQVKTCLRLLDGWDFLEDLARTFSREEELRHLKSPRMNKAYQKLFWGTNMLCPAEEKHWHPHWSTTEIRMLQKRLETAWDAFPELL